MEKMIDNYDVYGCFNKEMFFVNSYKRVPSELKLEVPLKGNRKNFELAKSFLDMEQLELEEVFRVWNISETQTENNEQDYIKNILFKSKAKKLCVELSMNADDLDIEFLYDHADKALEALVVEHYKKIRKRFGKAESPVFKVLTKSGPSFYTEEVNIEPFEVDVAKNYNDDFGEISSLIEKSLEVDKSGLILLHGQPGTGKTSYIKHLLSQYKELNFIFVQNDFVNQLLQPNFISFLINKKNSILIIEDAEKIIMSREQSNGNSVVSTILQLTDGLFSDYLSIKVICTFNTSIENIDTALMRKGRMIAFYEFKPLQKDKVRVLLDSMGEETIEAQEMTLAEVFNLSSTDFDKMNSKKLIGF